MAASECSVDGLKKAVGVINKLAVHLDIHAVGADEQNIKQVLPGPTDCSERGRAGSWAGANLSTLT
jgi:hypothetical protein